MCDTFEFRDTAHDPIFGQKLPSSADSKRKGKGIHKTK